MYDFFLNDVLMKEIFKDYLSLKIRNNKVLENEEERMKMNLQKLHA
jgi:D-Tyr-tRNAtyr deacylase